METEKEALNCIRLINRLEKTMDFKSDKGMNKR